MNADGNNLSIEEQRALREQKYARHAAEMREGMRRTRLERAARVTTKRDRIDAAFADGSIDEKLRAELKQLAANPVPPRYIPKRQR